MLLLSDMGQCRIVRQDCVCCQCTLWCNNVGVQHCMAMVGVGSSSMPCGCIWLLLPGSGTW